MLDFAPILYQNLLSMKNFDVMSYVNFDSHHQNSKICICLFSVSVEKNKCLIITQKIQCGIHRLGLVDGCTCK